MNPGQAELPTAVISALRREIAPLLRRARAGRRIETLHGRFVTAHLGGRPLILGWTGDGRRCAEAGLRSLLAWRPVSRLVVLGVAGGLSPEIEIARLVAAEEVRDAGGSAPLPDRRLSERAVRSGAEHGTIYTSESIVGTAAGKAELWRTLGRPANAVVDLETATWARVAAEHAIPYVAIRAVSDDAENDLPLDFERCRDVRGRIKSSRIAILAIVRPTLIGPLRALRGRVDACTARLASWAIDFLT